LYRLIYKLISSVKLLYIYVALFNRQRVIVVRDIDLFFICPTAVPHWTKAREMEISENSKIVPRISDENHKQAQLHAQENDCQQTEIRF